jgi:hypothetical protein
MNRNRIAILAGAAALAAAGIVAIPAQAATATCHAAVVKINWDNERKLAAADFRVRCDDDHVWVKLANSVATDGPCLGYSTNGSDRNVHYDFYPRVTRASGWYGKYCDDSGSGRIPLFEGTGGGGSW